MRSLDSGRRNALHPARGVLGVMCMADGVVDLFENLRFDDDAVLQDLLKRASDGQPASLIRLGDGEGKLIGYGAGVSEALVRNQLRIWFGERPFADAEIHEMRSALLAAVRQATHLGLPTDKRTLATDAEGRYTKDALQCQALWHSLDGLGVIGAHDLFGTAMIHRYAQITRWFTDLLDLGRPVVFVTRTHVAVNRLVKAFGIRDYHVHLIPGETWSRPEATSTHYPDRFHEVRAALARVPSGAIGLVGGGVLGKVYCTDIAHAGGVAIDCGALFDTWANDIPKERRGNMPDAHKLRVAHLRRPGRAAGSPGT
jgi:hypothetical protein